MQWKIKHFYMTFAEILILDYEGMMKGREDNEYR